MLCEECGLRPATIHLTKVLGSSRTERHLCAECAKEKGELDFIMNPHISIAGMLSGMLTQAECPAQQPGDRCEVCGKTYDDFAKVGRLGCGACYSRFESRLDPVLKRIHGSVEHIGKTPKRRPSTVRLKKQIDGLRKQLDAAVKQEAYEEAAALRDRIRELEKAPGQ